MKKVMTQMGSNWGFTMEKPISDTQVQEAIATLLAHMKQQEGNGPFTALLPTGEDNSAELVVLGQWSEPGKMHLVTIAAYGTLEAISYESLQEKP